jgi:hypothetical protein
MTGHSALRLRDGSTALVVIRHGESWGIYQLQGSEWELIQARGTREEAMAEALAGARRAGLIQ